MDQSILIVDDDELLLESYKAFLELEGFKVLAASSPYKAIQIVEKVNIDLSILDYNLPNMNGVQLGYLINKIREKAKIMFISGNSNIKEFVKEAKYDVSAVLTKPIEVSYLIDIVTRIIKDVEPVNEEKEITKIVENITRYIPMNNFSFGYKNNIQIDPFSI